MNNIELTLIKYYINSPIMLYSFLYNNADYCTFINTKILKNAISNEEMLPHLLCYNSYVKFLIKTNKIKDKKTFTENSKKILVKFPNYFWLKQPMFCFINMAKNIKNKTITYDDIIYIAPEPKLIKGFYEFIKLQKNRNKLNDKKIKKLFNQPEIDLTYIIKQVIKYKLV